MNESKIPSIRSKKRPFSSGDDCSGRLPSLKKKSVLMNITNTTVGEKCLQSGRDENMKLSLSSPFQGSNQSTNMRLLNKYFYGDPSVIEEVKRRERKVLLDINGLNKELRRVELETEELNEKTIPSLKYELNKKSQTFRGLKQETVLLQEEMQRLISECDKENKKHELIVGNLELKHSVNLQDKTNYWEKLLSEKKRYWEAELLKIHQKGPDPVVIRELQELKLEKDEKVEKLDRINADNKIICHDFENLLRNQLEEFKREKEKPLEHLINQNTSLESDISKLNVKKDEIETTIDRYRTETEILNKKIEQIEIRMKEYQTSSNETESDLLKLQKTYEEEKAHTDKVKMVATAAEREYQKQYEKMEQEQVQRGILENTIDELIGLLRCYAYLDEENLEREGAHVDFASRSILAENESHFFNRILPKSLISPHDLFNKECFLFVESCLKNEKNCNVISINDDLRMHFLKMVQTKFKDCKIDVQVVVLSDNDTSKDILNPNEFDLSAVIDEECIDFHSKRLPIDQVSKHITEEYDGVHVMKFEVYLNSNDSYHSIFFIQPSLDNIQKFDPNKFKNKIDSPISAFLQSLFARIQSLAIFRFEKADLSLLALSQHLRKLPNPK